jgi:hypothetical protein
MLTTIEPVTFEIESPNRQATEIAIIDRSARNYRYLATILAQRSIPVFVLTLESDGIVQISKILKHFTHLATVHLFAEAKEGSLNLGSNWLELENVGDYFQQLQQWENFGNPQKEIVIYNLAVATGERGWLFVEWLYLLTGATIETSDSRALLDRV